MSSVAQQELINRFYETHNGDKEQLEVVFSNSPRLIVEAPAGYGKTMTMISRIAYLIASGCIPNPKRILALTFSVNAALKVKREVAEKLPALVGAQNSPVSIGNKVTVTNYHGFCKKVLKKYGYLVSDILKKDVNLLRGVNESEISKNEDLKNALSATELQQLIRLDNSINSASMPNMNSIREYNQIVIKKMFPKDFITYNAVILLVLEVFYRFPEVQKFYQSYYPLIVVDEFQDTNCIAWALLESIISDQTQLLLLGDPMQRIYGFLGALPDIMPVVEEKYSMSKVTLKQNYRFCNNYEMHNLDKYLRANAETYFAPMIGDDQVAHLPAYWGNSQQDEAKKVVFKIKNLLGDGADRIAVLFHSRNKNSEIVETELVNSGLAYFYGMFRDVDPDYVNFHNKCLEMFIDKFGKSKNISKNALFAFSESVKGAYGLSDDKTIASMLRLLDALVEKVFIDYADMLAEDKYTLLVDIFENRQLKQAMEYVDSQIVLSTVHGAKGLEWDYVFLADLERWIFPSNYTCNLCQARFSNSIRACCYLPNPLPADFREKALDELSVFYVGATRARKQVYVSASAKRINSKGEEKGSCFSCLASLDGINLVDADSFEPS